MSLGHASVFIVFQKPETSKQTKTTRCNEYIHVKLSGQKKRTVRLTEVSSATMTKGNWMERWKRWSNGAVSVLWREVELETHGR